MKRSVRRKIGFGILGALMLSMLGVMVWAMGIGQFLIFLGVWGSVMAVYALAMWLIYS